MRLCPTTLVERHASLTYVHAKSENSATTVIKSVTR